MSAVPLAALSPVLTGTPRTEHRAMSFSATWSKTGGFGAGEVRDVTPTSIVLSGADGVRRGDRISVQIRWTGGVFVVAGKASAPSSMLGGLRIELDRPNNEMFRTLWGNLG